MNKQILLVSALCAGLAFAPSPVRADAIDPVANVKIEAKDPNPFADYGPAMASTKEHPLLSFWQVAHAKEIAEATTDAKLDAFLACDKAADGLLAQVKEAYKSEPIPMIQIASVTQRAQVSSKETLARWVAALKRAQKAAPDAYRRDFFRDQLALCGVK